MRRNASLLLLLAIALVGIGAVSASPPGQGTPPPGTPWVNVCDGQGNCTPYVPYVAVATATPRPTTTPEPSATTTPTVTPSPTNTPQPTATPEPSPTQEICTGVPEVGLNIRDDVWGNRVAQFQAGDCTDCEPPTVASQTLRFEARRQDSAGDYWYAFWLNPPWTYGWVHGDYVDFADPAQCETLTAETPTPDVGLRQGMHFILNALWGQVAPFCQYFDYGKDTTNTNLAWLCSQVNPDMVISFRSLVTDDGQRDCPSDWEWYAPSVWWAKLRNHLPDGYDFYEVVNECHFTDYRQMAKFFIEIAKAAEQEGKRILAFSFFPGSPEVEAWGEMCDYFEFAWERGHGVAFHLSAFWPEGVPEPPGALWLNSPWVARYYTLVDEVLRSACGLSLVEFPGPVVASELGITDGRTEVSCEGFAVAREETARQHMRDGIVDAQAWWNVGGPELDWLNLGPCLYVFAE